MTFEDQIDLVNGGRRGAESALAMLVAGGNAAVAALVARMEHGPGSGAAADILGFVDLHPDQLDVLGGLTRHPNSSVRRATIRVLGRTGDPRALPILEQSYARHTASAVLDALGDLGAPGGVALVRAILAKEVGDLTAPDVLEVIHRRALEDFDTSCPDTVVKGARALAKLGDFSLVNVVRGLARFMVDEDDEIYAFMVRQSAIHALDVSVGPGIAATLEQCYDDPGEDDVVWFALDAMLHLGRVTAVDRWIELLSSDRTGVQRRAQSCIERLIGEKPPHVREQAETWWKARRYGFDPAICYYAGKPATPESLVRGARGRNSKTTRMDLRQMTGLAFITPTLDPPAVPETQAIDAWWAAHATDFVPGKLHRWGRVYDPTACDTQTSSFPRKHTTSPRPGSSRARSGAKKKP